MKNSKIISTMEALKPIFIAVIASFIVLCFVRLTIVNGQSMEPNLYEKQKLLLNVTAYTFSDVERGDIIVATPEEFDMEIIKRVVGLPGETIEIRDNVIYINGEALDEPYVKEEMVTADIPEFTLGANEYFICGDNRNNSLDSRSEILGPITKDEIFGKVIINFSKFEIL